MKAYEDSPNASPALSSQPPARLQTAIGGKRRLESNVVSASNVPQHPIDTLEETDQMPQKHGIHCAYVAA